MYSNMKYYENICNCLRVIQQYINRKLKSANCWQRTSLNQCSKSILSIKIGINEVQTFEKTTTPDLLEFEINIFGLHSFHMQNTRSRSFSFIKFLFVIRFLKKIAALFKTFGMQNVIFESGCDTTR